jgi:TonB family protein
MKAFLFTLIALTFISSAKAQKNDTTIYYPCTPKNHEPEVIDGPVLLFDACPQFPGGDKAYYKYLAKHLKWPDKSGMIDIQGKVLLKFIIEKDGKISHTTVAKSLDPLFDAAAVRVIKNMPNWKPAILNGKAVRVGYYLAIPFKIADYKMGNVVKNGW